MMSRKTYYYAMMLAPLSVFAMLIPNIEAIVLAFCTVIYLMIAACFWYFFRNRTAREMLRWLLFAPFIFLFASMTTISLIAIMTIGLSASFSELLNTPAMIIFPFTGSTILTGLMVGYVFVALALLLEWILTACKIIRRETAS